jgi:hypothetical protein
MTVCISAIAARDEAIVSCVDTRISTGTTSFDPIIGRKMCGFRGWTMLSSGTTCYSEGLVDTFQSFLNDAGDNDPPTVHRLLEAALRTEMPRFIAARYLTPYGIDMPTFLGSARGPNGFTDERWNELSRLMLDYSDSYDVELLVSGWGQTQERFGPGGGGNQASAEIYSVNRNGVTPHSNEGFYACGSGADAAHSMLSFFNCQRYMTLAEAIYYVAAAKFMSERTAGVGANTLMRVGTRLGDGEFRGYYIELHELEQIRKMWESQGAPRMPDGAEDLIVTIVARHQKAQEVSLGHMARNVQKAIPQSGQNKPE